MAVDPDVPWDLVSQVRRSRRKSEIVSRLDAEPACAAELTEEMKGISRPAVSNVLRELKNMNPPIVTCITPEQPHYRLYALTEEGRKVRDHI